MTAPGPSSGRLPFGPWRRAALGAAVVAAAFGGLVAATLAWNHRQARRADLLTSAEMTELRARWKASPRDPKVLDAIRALDLRLRRQYVRRQWVSERGGWLLLGFLAAALIAVHVVAYRRPSPRPGPAQAAPDAPARAAARARWLAGAVGAVLGAGAVILWLGPRPYDAPDRLALGGPGPVPTPAEIGKPWPRFRGAGGAGVAAGADAPRAWDAKTGEGIAWKTPIGLPGWSSPIVWSDRVFCTGADKNRRVLYCLDARTGRIVWTAMVRAPNTPAAPAKTAPETGYAAPTPATDGRRVVALFANGDLAAFDLAGNRLWATNVGLPENMYGHSSSPILYRDLVIVQLDQSRDADDLSRSELLAFDAADGQVAWSVPREVRDSWSTPIVAATAEGDQLILAGEPAVVSYDPANGLERWRADIMVGDVGPSPVYAGGRVFVGNDGGVFAAIRTDGDGDIAKTHVAWRADENLPDTASPLTDGRLVWLAASYGTVTCLEADTGKKVYEKSLERVSFNASPTLVGKAIYLLSTKGLTIIIEAGRTYKELARCDLSEETRATPAFAAGRIFIRTAKHLYCIGPKD